MRYRTGSYVLMMAALAGCAHTLRQASLDETQIEQPHPAGQVQARLIEASHDHRYVLAAGASATTPVPMPDRPMPAYPSGLLAAGLPPIEVRVRVIVDADGHVTQVSGLDAGTPVPATMLAAVRETVQRWQFTALVMRHADGRLESLPFHLDYAFVFRQIDGKGSVAEAPSD